MLKNCINFQNLVKKNMKNVTVIGGSGFLRYRGSQRINNKKYKVKIFD